MSKKKLDQEKQIAAAAAAEMVEDGMKIGLGTGSTINYFLESLGARVKKGLKVQGIPTSERTSVVCREQGIELLDFASVEKLDLAFDGADEVDTDFNMIKGGGGALMREKIVASAADRVVILVDSSKQVENLGSFPLPVEIIKFGFQQVERKFKAVGIDYTMRMTDYGQPYVTDNGNYILDCTMGEIIAPYAMAEKLKLITGVVDSGLFINLCDVLVIGRGKNVEMLENKRK